MCSYHTTISITNDDLDGKNSHSGKSVNDWGHGRVSEKRPNDGHGPQKRDNDGKKVAKQRQNAHQLDGKANEGPLDENQENAQSKGYRSTQLLTSSKEGQRFLGSDQKSDSDEEENLC